MVVALQKLLNTYFGEKLNCSPFFKKKKEKRLSNFRCIYWPREGMKNSCCLSSKPSTHQSRCSASVFVRQNCVCCLDRPETKRWVDGLWPLHLQELRRRVLFNKVANRSHVQRQAAKQLEDSVLFWLMLSEARLVPVHLWGGSGTLAASFN